MGIWDPSPNPKRHLPFPVCSGTSALEPPYVSFLTTPHPVNVCSPQPFSLFWNPWSPSSAPPSLWDSSVSPLVLGPLAIPSFLKLFSALSPPSWDPSALFFLPPGPPQPPHAWTLPASILGTFWEEEPLTKPLTGPPPRRRGLADPLESGPASADKF